MGDVALSNHPIQLLKVDIKELHFRSNASADSSYEIPEKMIKLGVGYTEINEHSGFAIGVKVTLGDEENESNKYFSKIELIGHFHVNTSEFDEKYVAAWAQQNAPIILLPFIREHLYSITLRAGFKPFILPLIQVPTTKPLGSEVVPSHSD